MKKIVKILLLAWLPALVMSCANDDGEDSDRKVEFRAISPTPRTALTTNDAVMWKAGDQIVVFQGKDDPSGSVSDANAEDGVTGYFKVLLDEPAADESFYAAYPAQTSVSINNGTISMSIPDEQIPVPDSFDPNAALTVASTPANSRSLYFYNATALIAVSFSQDFTGKIQLEAPSISGDVQVSNIAQGKGGVNPTVAAGSTTLDEVSLTGSFVAGNTYYVAIIPHNYSSIVLKVYNPSESQNPVITKTFSPTTAAEICPSDIIEIAKFQDVDPLDYVDLQLPSRTLWAKCNVGAASPEDYGLFFQWGDVVGHSVTENYAYTWANYKYCVNSSTTLTKYCTDSDCWGGEGTIDNVTELELADDAAYVVKGKTWRMPTDDQISELCSSGNTTKSWETVNGVQGILFTSKYNGKTLFIPAAGYFSGSSNDYMGTGCYIYSRTLSDTWPYDAQCLHATATPLAVSAVYNRMYGMPVRAVKL